MVKNSKGEKIALVKNPLLSLYDPRNYKNKDGSQREVSDKIKYEINIVEDTDSTPQAE